MAEELKDGGNTFRFRLLIVGLLMLAGLLFLSGKLCYEQVFFGEHYRNRIARQSIRRIRIPALRGRILSSDYQILAENEARYDLVLYLNEMRRYNRRHTIQYVRETASALARSLGRPDSLTTRAIERHIRIMPGMPLTVFTDLNSYEIAVALMMRHRYSGIAVQPTPVRRYPEKALAATVIGYVRKDDPWQAADRGEYFYYQSDLTGKSGAERAFEYSAGNDTLRGLRGTPGYAMVRVDNLGFVSDERIARQEPVNGNNVVLTLDLKAQKIGETLLHDRVGALALLDADTGAVLALVSSPGYDLSRVSPNWSPEYYRELCRDPRLPLYPRAYAGQYTPGSIFKPLIALALLKNGTDPAATVNCTGRTAIGNSGISCASRAGHGELDLVTAIERSCNVYFIESAIRTGLDALLPTLHAAGIGRATGLELGGAAGLCPSREIKRRRDQSRWTDYDTGLVSIGQGMVLVTPLQAARYAAAIANGGRLPRVHLLKEVRDPEGRLLYRTQPVFDGDLGAEGWQLDLIRQGMFQVINAPTGSGRRAQSDLLTLYGKTGTAEVDTRQGRIKNTWFIAFGEHRRRRYAMALLVEEGRSGGLSCAPIVREFFERYLPGLELRGDGAELLPPELEAIP